MTTPLRIAVGGIYHETNTFAADLTALEAFHAYQYASGVDLLGMQSTRSEMGGFLDGLSAHHNTAVPTTYAAAVPSGTVSHLSYLSLRDQILAQLALHGRFNWSATRSNMLPPSQR